MTNDVQLVSDIRRFNRFYTIQLGLLQQHVFDSDFSLTEVRVLYEVSHNHQTTATGIREALNIDAGYLSRVLRNFEKKGLIIKHPLPEDGRSSYLQLTARGKKIMTEFNELSDGQISQMLAHLSTPQRQKMANAMGTVRTLLKAPGSELRLADVEIRHGLRPGDVGNIIRIHGELYAQEYQYDLRFEQYVTQTLHEFLPVYDPVKDRVWMATCFGELAGMIAIIHKGRGKAQLRWFLVRPEFRGIGLGRALMTAAMDFCREQRFREVYLLTTNQQQTAAAIYLKAGFVKTGSEPAQLWGQDLYEERYELKMPTGN